MALLLKNLLEENRNIYLYDILYILVLPKYDPKDRILKERST